MPCKDCFKKAGMAILLSDKVDAGAKELLNQRETLHNDGRISIPGKYEGPKCVHTKPQWPNINKRKACLLISVFGH